MELLRRLRQKSDLPVIFLTSKDDEIDELFGLKMGADDFITKPFSQRLLVERVKACFDALLRGPRVQFARMAADRACLSAVVFRWTRNVIPACGRASPLH